MGRKKILFTFAVGCLIFLGGYLLIEFSEKAVASAAEENSAIVQTASSDPRTVSEAVRTRKKLVASIVVGRLGYNLYNDGTATVTDETGAVAGLKAKAADIIIPSHVSYQGKRYTVTAIGQKCFSDGKDGEQKYGRIVLPDTIQTIGMGAFYEVSCEELVIPDSVTTIENYAFYGMTVK